MSNIESGGGRINKLPPDNSLNVGVAAIGSGIRKESKF